MDQRFHRLFHLPANGGAILLSWVRTGPAGISSEHCMMIRSDWRISSTRTRYRSKQSPSCRREYRNPYVRRRHRAGICANPKARRAAQHRTGESPVERVVLVTHADIDRALAEDTVFGQQGFDIVDDLREVHRRTSRYLRARPPADRGERHRGGNTRHAAGRPKHVHRIPSAFRVLRSPRATASSHRHQGRRR